MSAVIIGHFLAAVIGVSLGLMGGGGSILAVPVLVYVMGVTPKAAIAMSLAIVGTVSLIAAIPHWQMGNVRLGTALLFGSTAMLGAYLGARLAALPWMTDTVQMGLFAVTMLLAAVLMIRKSAPLSQAAIASRCPEGAIASDTAPSANVEENADSGPTSKHRYAWFGMAIEGMGVGVLTGLVGVGGGFAIVPALVLLGNVPIKQAAGTSLLIIALKSVTGFLGYLGQVELDWSLMASFTVAASFGTILGIYLVPLIKSRQLQLGFSCFLLLMAGFILWENWAS